MLIESKDYVPHTEIRYHQTLGEFYSSKCLNNYSTEFQARVSTSLHNLRLHLHKTQPKCVLLIFSVELIYLVTSLHDAEKKTGEVS